MDTKAPILLDCTLRDGGYYTDWHYAPELIADYLVAMRAARIDVVELGFRFAEDRDHKGACAFTSDEFLRSLSIPKELRIAVMVNGGDLLRRQSPTEILEQLFPVPAGKSPVSLVRIACHIEEIEGVRPAIGWLAKNGYAVGLNLMQAIGRSDEELSLVARVASEEPLEVLYFADSLGSAMPGDISRVVQILRSEWSGPLGIHTHDNLGLALQNSLRALDEGASWVDGTVTGMGRGPGNAKTGELVIELKERKSREADIAPLMGLIREHFAPLKAQHGWGTNHFYYLAGKRSIHPSYVQEMLQDSRYDATDILAAIELLSEEDGKRFRTEALETTRHFFAEAPSGEWNPEELLAGQEVLLLGAGPSLANQAPAIESLIRRSGPLVVALNTVEGIDPSLVDLRIACHPIRLLADAEAHILLTQPLIAPASAMPPNLLERFKDKQLLDYGVRISSGVMSARGTCCTIPNSLALGYALAMAAGGGAKAILLAGFDGYPGTDRRNRLVGEVLEAFVTAWPRLPLRAITPTQHDQLEVVGIEGLV